MKRRTVLRLGAAAVGAGVLGAGVPLAGSLLAPAQPGRLLGSTAPLPPRYRVPLPVPQVAAPSATDGTTDYYEITQREADLRILPGLTTRAWTYGGTFPGPTLRSRSGRRTVVRHRNALSEPTVVHLHGGHTPAEHDGYPTDLVAPGGAPRDYAYPMDQRAATLWYHDHRMGRTGSSVWRGLAGFHLVTDDEEAALPLPRGRRDLPLMITDRSFAADGSFQYPAAPEGGATGAYMNGVLGDVVLVNGAPWPVLAADPARYRLRLLNASNARRYRLELDPPPPGGGALVQIGSDGGLLSRPLAHDALEIAPGERFDVVVDFSRYRPGTSVRLVNRLDSGPAGEVMRFDVTGTDRTDDSAVPARLAAGGGEPDPRDAVATRTFLFRQGTDGQWTVNDLAYQPGRALARPALGKVEIWRFVTDFHHPVHVHLNAFRVLSRNTGGPGAYDQGWKDTVDVRPSEAVEIVTRFTDHAGTFLLHCHNLEHEDMAMMADFVTA
ncbi:multicopper oxidase family protein [Amycolatopsis rhizosphaerae]|uniref:Multicopper oxidase CueO n=1 Tax=Amycolatopsis rhizosphaerae TaxID=2053003 RepID=A0A558A9Y8_9PSEU|nr:multicopper oxidase domain-containing protein [Amycolatopsis rhizosphaerae]TVT21078.1 multicopper oxidase family protein [Amycolatopsis rhizosphaerae]